VVAQGRRELVRYGAAVAFLLAVTVAVLLIRSGIHGGHGSTTTAPTTTAHVTTPKGPHKFYRVRPGDTLEEIAIRFRTSVDKLTAFNPGVDPNSLRIGQRLRVR